MWLAVGNVNTAVLRAAPAELEWLAGFLSFEQRRGRRETERLSMLADVGPRPTFPTGFVPMVLKAAREAGVHAEVGEKRRAPAAPDPAADLSWLDVHPATGERIDYQRGAVNAAVRATRGIVHVPTGGGKTEIAVGLAKLLPVRWLLVVHRSTLMHQAAERWEARTGERAGRIGDGGWEAGARFTCATFQTLRAAQENRDPRFAALAAGTAGLLVDEAHTLPAETFYAVVRAVPAYWRIGLSATPLARGDRRSLLAVAALGPVIYRVRAETLIEAGVIARPRIRMVKFKQEDPGAEPPPDVWDDGTGDGMRDERTFRAVYDALIAGSDARNELLARIAVRAAKPGFVFVTGIDHGRELVRRLAKAGVRAELVWGARSTESRRAAVVKLERGDLDVVVCSAVFNEGVDVPCLRSVVVAGAGKSAIAAVQRVGRGSRRADGKSTFEVWDVLDDGHRWMKAHARARRRAYAREGYEVEEVDAP